MTARRILAALAATAAATIAPLTLNTIDAGAQTPNPCPSCVDDNKLPPGRRAGTGFFLHTPACVEPADGTGFQTVEFANKHPRKSAQATVNGQISPWIPPGGTWLFVIRTAGPTIDITRSAVYDDGTIAIRERFDQYPCPCGDSSTTVPPVPTTPPPTPATTVPGSPPPSTSSRPPSTPPSSTPPLTGTLPHVGIDVVPLLWVTAGLIAAGAACLIPRHRKRDV